MRFLFFCIFHTIFLAGWDRDLCTKIIYEANSFSHYEKWCNKKIKYKNIRRKMLIREGEDKHEKKIKKNYEWHGIRNESYFPQKTLWYLIKKKWISRKSFRFTVFPCDDVTVGKKKEEKLVLNFISIPVYMLLTLLTFFQEFKSLVSSTQIELRRKKLLLLFISSAKKWKYDSVCVCVCLCTNKASL